MGINLFGANHVVIFDASWNPAEDSQAIFRVYRFGQTKPVHVYRLVAHQLMEGKIYKKQIVKTALSMHVVEDQHTKQHFNTADIAVSLEIEDEGGSQSMAQSGAQVDDETAEDKLKNPRGEILSASLEALRPTIRIRVHPHDSLIEDDADEHLGAAEKWIAIQLEEKNIVEIAHWCGNRYTQYRMMGVSRLTDVVEVEQHLDIFFCSFCRTLPLLTLSPSPPSPPKRQKTPPKKMYR